MSRTFIILMVLSILHFPIGCGSCGSNDFDHFKARITELEAEVGTFSPSMFRKEYSREFDRAAINIKIVNMEYFGVSELIPHKFHFFPSAFACDPGEPEPTQKISSLSVTSSKSVYMNDLKYSANSNLAELFVVVDSKSFGNTALIPGLLEGIDIDDFIGYQNEDIYIFGVLRSSITFQVKNKPDSAIAHDFLFNFTLNDSTIFNVEIPVFEVSS